MSRRLEQVDLEAPLRHQVEAMSKEERLLMYALLKEYPPMSCVKLPGLCEMLLEEQKQWRETTGETQAA